jgi:hypothetical protein
VTHSINHFVVTGQLAKLNSFGSLNEALVIGLF